MNLPADFLHLLSEVLDPDEKERLATALDEKPSLSIRFNPDKLRPDKTHAAVPWCTTGQYLDARPSFTLDPLFHAGAYYVQEASSMFLEQFIRCYFSENLSIKALDLCAAPGGKSTHLLSLLDKNSLLVSNEVIKSRAGILSENIQKWGHSNVIVTQNDPTAFKQLSGLFDLIVVDAPCSGEGLFRKDPKAIQEWSIDNVRLCSQRQRRILAEVFEALSQNGLLIYSTCTFNSIENESNLKWLASQHDIDFVKIPDANRWGVEEVNENGIVGYRFLPSQLRGEGFFISGIVRRSKPESVRTQERNISSKPMKNLPDPLNQWIDNANDLYAIEDDNQISFLPSKWVSEIARIVSSLNCVQIGTRAGAVKHHKFIPDHALALSTHLKSDLVLKIELTKEQAIQYLRKESLSIPMQAKGFLLATFSGVGIGWLNQIEGRLNNLYPMSWRIRMTG